MVENSCSSNVQLIKPVEAISSPNPTGGMTGSQRVLQGESSFSEHSQVAGSAGFMEVPLVGAHVLSSVLRWCCLETATDL